MVHSPHSRCASRVTFGDVQCSEQLHALSHETAEVSLPFHFLGLKTRFAKTFSYLQGLWFRQPAPQKMPRIVSHLLWMIQMSKSSCSKVERIWQQMDKFFLVRREVHYQVRHKLSLRCKQQSIAKLATGWTHSCNACVYVSDAWQWIPRH